MEKTINININGQHASASALASVNATVGIMYCEFAFNDYWDAFPAKKAHFENTNIKYGTVTADIINGRCKVPADVLRADGCIMVAIEGTNTDGQTERSAPVVIIKQYKTITDGVNTIEPTPDQYAQYVEEVGGAITEYFNEHKEEFKGDPGDDYVLTETDKIEIAGITVEEIKPLIDGKMEFYKLDTEVSGTVVTFYHDGVQLDFEAISDKYFDNKYFVYAECLNLTFIPCFPPTETDQAIEFISTYIYGGEVMVDRLIINSNNEGKFEEKYIAEKSDISNLQESLSEKADKSELDNKVDDVKINGTSIVTDGVADVPTSKYSKAGLSWVARGYGLASDENTGEIYLAPLNRTYVDTRITSYAATHNAITAKELDYAVECAMGDGKGAEWSEEHKANARKRIGEPQFELIEEITLTEEMQMILRTAEPNGTPYNFKSIYVDFNIPATGGTATLYGFYNSTSRDYSKYAFEIPLGVYTSVRKSYAKLTIKNGILETEFGGTTNATTNTSKLTFAKYVPMLDNITSLYFGSSSATNIMPSGTNIKIYGIRA